MEIGRKRTHNWTNPLEMAEKVKKMSGFDFLNGILNGEIPPAPIAETLGFHPLGLEEGKAVTIKDGKMKSTGKIIHLGRTTALVEANLTNEAGKVYAHGVSTCMIFKF